MKIIIAIDGYSACGKSTLAKQLAAHLGYIFIDTGAMYRAITLYFLNHDIALHDEAAVAEALKHIRLHFAKPAPDGHSDIYLNGTNVSKQIREMSVSEKVSTVAAIKSVRLFAVHLQRQMGISGGVVMDGRDIGTVVFPNAQLKIFMTADMDVRTQRRFAELQATQPDITLEAVRANLKMRDEKDSNRAESPLRKADDARVLDNSHISPKEQLTIALRWAQELIEDMD